MHLWAIVSPWLSESVRRRVTTVDAEHTRELVSKLAPASSLPQAYGGTCEELPAEVAATLGIEGHLTRLRGIYDGS